MTYNIQLSTPTQRDSDEPGFWVDDNIIAVRSDARIDVYRLPRGKPRVSLSKMGRGREQLVIGGFTTTLVTVTGPTQVIRQLRGAVL